MLRVISRSCLTKENDYVAQCVGCLTITAWVKDQSIGIIKRNVVKKDIRSHNCPLDTLLNTIFHVTILVMVKG